MTNQVLVVTRKVKVAFQRELVVTKVADRNYHDCQVQTG